MRADTPTAIPTDAALSAGANDIVGCKAFTIPESPHEAAYPDGYAHDAAHQGERDRLQQELPHDVGPSRAQGLAQAYLADALGHVGQHHVHDADAAHQKRYGGDAPQQQPEPRP